MGFFLVFVSSVTLFSAYLPFSMNPLAVLAFTFPIPSERTLMFRLHAHPADAPFSLVLQLFSELMTETPLYPAVLSGSRKPPLPSCSGCLYYRCLLR